jgi:cell wall-associated NlpC family hydrolase
LRSPPLSSTARPAMPTKATLSGDKGDLDPRLHAARPDLADLALKGRVEAERFVVPVAYACTVPFKAMFHAPDGEQCSELLAGEHFMALDARDGWAWGWSAHDHYVGYIAADALTEAVNAPPIVAQADPIDFARRSLGTPYVWGGRGGAGIDCSSLVQRSMAVRGVQAQRDSDMQRATLGDVLPENAILRRGDILFFPGHVGMMSDATTLIHATRYYGKTVEEPLDQVIARVKRKNDGTGIVARKRIVE